MSHFPSMPALLKMTSRRPYVRTAEATISRTSASAETSALTAIAVPPSVDDFLRNGGNVGFVPVGCYDTRALACEQQR